MEKYVAVKFLCLVSGNEQKLYGKNDITWGQIRELSKSGNEPKFSG